MSRSLSPYNFHIHFTGSACLLQSHPLTLAFEFLMQNYLVVDTVVWPLTSLSPVKVSQGHLHHNFISFFWSKGMTVMGRGWVQKWWNNSIPTEWWKDWSWKGLMWWRCIKVFAGLQWLVAYIVSICTNLVLTWWVLLEALVWFNMLLRSIRIVG